VILKDTFPVDLHDGQDTITVSPGEPVTKIIFLHLGHLTVFSIMTPLNF
jgi:hypothetical protein